MESSVSKLSNHELKVMGQLAVEFRDDEFCKRLLPIVDERDPKLKTSLKWLRQDLQTVIEGKVPESKNDPFGRPERGVLGYYRNPYYVVPPSDADNPFSVNPKDPFSGEPKDPYSGGQEKPAGVDPKDPFSGNGRDRFSDESKNPFSDDNGDSGSGDDKDPFSDN